MNETSRSLRIELRQWRQFVALAEELHFGRAATRLHMTQPPLTQAIAGLEAALGVRLFERTQRSVKITPAGAALLPEVARSLASEFTRGEVNSWTGVRCAAADRRPLLGEVAPGLWVSTAMGSRGLTFSVLCAELLAARLHAEPLPLERKLAQALDVSRTGARASDARRLTPADGQTRSSSA